MGVTVYRGCTVHGYLNKHHLSLSLPLGIYGLMKLKNSCLGQLPQLPRSGGDMSRFICSTSANQLTQSGETTGKLRLGGWQWDLLKPHLVQVIQACIKGEHYGGLLALMLHCSMGTTASEHLQTCTRYTGKTAKQTPTWPSLPHLICYNSSPLTLSLPSTFFSFSFLNKANLHQLQQPCNLRDKGSYDNAVEFYTAGEKKIHCLGGDDRSTAQRRDMARKKTTGTDKTGEQSR